MINHIQKLWLDLGLPGSTLQTLDLGGTHSSLVSSFNIGQAAQSSIAAAALAASQIYTLRCGERQSVTVDLQRAEQECTAHFTIDGKEPQVWAKYSGLYKCLDGYIRVHANFDHHRDSFLSLLDLPQGEACDRQEVEARVLKISAQQLEILGADNGAIISMLRSLEDWDEMEQARAMANVPPLIIEKIGDAEPQPFSEIQPSAKPLSGVRILELTRVLAGPVCGKTLAAYGADVLLINSPELPNIEHLAETSRGKLSAHLNLDYEDGRQRLRELVADSDVFVQGYRPGGLERKGFDAQNLAELKPGIVCVDLSAYGHLGPWAQRRGFDSILQTSTGFNFAEAQAHGLSAPKAFPIQILDFATGFLMAYGAQVALRRRAIEGGSWQVRASLLQTANWLRSMGRVDIADAKQSNVVDSNLNACLQPYQSNFGSLHALPHAAEFSVTTNDWLRPSSRPGTHSPQWIQSS